MLCAVVSLGVVPVQAGQVSGGRKSPFPGLELVGQLFVGSEDGRLVGVGERGGRVVASPDSVWMAAISLLSAWLSVSFAEATGISYPS